MSSYAKGPYKPFNDNMDDKDDSKEIYQESSGFTIASYYHSDFDPDTTLANAYLMAAAPEMLEILYETCAIFGMLHDDLRLPELARPVWRKSREIIAKAEGNAL